MKKGFTLIELLAVIIILAILMVVAVPNILSSLNDAKLTTFKTQAQSIWKSAEQQYLKDSLAGTQQTCYSTGQLDLSSISDNVSYFVTLDNEGQATSIQVLDSVQKFKAEGTTIEGITSGTTNETQAYTCDNPVVKIREFVQKLYSWGENRLPESDAHGNCGSTCYSLVYWNEPDEHLVTPYTDTLAYQIALYCDGILDDGERIGIVVKDYGSKLIARLEDGQIKVTSDPTLTEDSAYMECNG